MGKGNWKCPVCKKHPEKPIKFTAGLKSLKLGRKIILRPGATKILCGPHLRELHV